MTAILTVRTSLCAGLAAGLLVLIIVPGAQAIQVEAQPDYTATTLRSALAHGPLSTDVPGLRRSRSVPLAFGLSALVPGAGQAYNRHWIKASVAVAAEIGTLWAWSSWRSQGLSGRDEYQATAHAHWSPVQYALWLNDFTSYLNTLPGGSGIEADLITIEEVLYRVDLSRPSAWTSNQQLAVRRLILDIRALEMLVYHPETGARFSHQLPFFGAQQYYELVGKYFQFAPGWDDYTFLVRDGVASWIDEDGNFIETIDPEKTAPDGSKPNVSRRFFAYADSHAAANDYLRRASRVTILFFANHLLAAVDAAVSAKLHNNRLQTRLGFYQREPMLTMQLSF